MRRLAIALSLATLVGLAFAGTVSAGPFPGIIPLPGASSLEGIATGTGSTFYAGDLFRGDIFRGDLRAGSASVFIHAPAGRMALGMKVDTRHGLLFVAGGFTGQAYVYDTHTGADVAVLQLATPGQGLINDVIVTRRAAWFTDSFQPHLYRVPIGLHGSIGSASTLVVTGPAADLSGPFVNLNGIAATHDGKRLIVAHSGNGALYTVDPVTGASAPIVGANVPDVDGILFEAGRMWVVQNFLNEITEWTISGDLSSATLVRTITNPAFEVPTTVARDGNRLAAVNAKFDTGFPPSATSFEVVVVQR